MKINTKNGTWKVDGINLIPSDSIYQKLVNAIESLSLGEKHLQRETGFNSPILVNIPAKHIQFCPF